MSKKLTNDEYRKAEGISRSSLFKISKSPAHFKWQQDNPPEPAPSLIFGRAFHKIVLEPETFDDEFILAPECDRRTTIGKAVYNTFLEVSQGKDVISAEDYDTICQMRDAVMLNKYAVALLQGKKEQSFFWVDETTGEPCKCRTDILTTFEGFDVITDLKSCASADTESLMKDCIKYGYDLQVAMYKEGVEINTGKPHSFIFIAVEKTAPFGVNVLQADDLFIRRGQEIFRELIGIYHECKTTDNWYGYNGFSGIINNLSLPRWLAADYE